MFTATDDTDLVPPPAPEYVGHRFMEPYVPGWSDAEIVQFETTPDGAFLEVTGTVDGQPFQPFVSSTRGTVLLGFGLCTLFDTIGHPLAEQGGNAFELEVRHLDYAGNASDWVSVSFVTESRTDGQSGDSAAETGIQDTVGSGCSQAGSPVGWGSWVGALLGLVWTSRRQVRSSRQGTLR